MSTTCPFCQQPVSPSDTTCRTCGAALSVQGGATSLAAGLSVGQGRYEIGKVLGQGGFGITYLATDRQLRRTVAIKELFLTGWTRSGATVLTPNNLSAAEVKDAKERFLTEARVLSGIRQAGIVQVLDYFEDNQTAYLVMEYLAGHTLGDEIAERGALDATTVGKIAFQVAQSLAVIHAGGLLHRDIKPDNIFLADGGQVVLIDFGSVRAFQSGKTVSHTRLVTPGYAPLEQYGHAARYGPYTDIYALGATLHHALTGQMPPAATDLILGTPLPPLPPSTPAALSRATLQAMSRQVEERPQTAQEFLDLLGGGQPKTPSPAPSLPVLLPTNADIQRAWASLATVARPQPAALAVPIPPNPVTPAMRRRRWRALMQALIFGGLGYWLWGSNVVFLGVICFFVAFLNLLGVSYRGRPQVLHGLEIIDQDIEDLRHVLAAGGQAALHYDAALGQLGEIHDQLQQPQALVAQRQKQAAEQHIQNEITRELGQQRLEAGIVAGIGEKRVKMLRQHGIATALDIDKKRLKRVAGIGEKTSRDLYAWRRELEAEARKQAQRLPPPLTEAAKQAADRELADLYAQLSGGVQTLQAAISTGAAEDLQAQTKLADLLRQRAELAKKL